MITLRDILKLNETVTLLDLDVRRPDGRLIRRTVIGEHYRPSSFELGDIERGRLEYIDERINIYGRTNKSGFSETCYGMIYKAIPKDYLDAEVETLNWIRERHCGVKGQVLRAHIVPVQMTLNFYQNQEGTNDNQNDQDK